MNEIDRINKVINGLIDVICCSSVVTSNIHNPQKLTDLKNLINQPIESTQPEGYQGLNKWYLTKMGCKIRVKSCDGQSILGYGVLPSGKWDKFIDTIISEIERTLTEEEIISAIKVGLKQHGIVEGVDVTSLFGNICNKIDFSQDFFDVNENKLWVSHDGGTTQKCLVFDNGEFAKVVEKETTDRELLKKSIFLLEFYQAEYYNNNSKEINKLTEYLLTKLNKHLKK